MGTESWGGINPLPGEARGPGNTQGHTGTKAQNLAVDISSLFHLGENKPKGGRTEDKTPQTVL